MLQFHITTARLFQRPTPENPASPAPWKLISLAYSGAPGFVNEPSTIQLHNKGPLPAGFWRLRQWTAAEVFAGKKGPIVFELVPFPQTLTFGRSGFLIHWDNQHHDFSASEGCLILCETTAFSKLLDGESLEVIL